MDLLGVTGLIGGLANLADDFVTTEEEKLTLANQASAINLERDRIQAQTRANELRAQNQAETMKVVLAVAVLAVGGYVIVRALD